MSMEKRPKLDWENQTVFKDTVLGYINVPKAMADKLIDHEIFQRLQDVAQTGMETLYPGATHNRFCHSVGVYHLGKMAFHCFQQNVQRQHREEIYGQVADTPASCERIWNRWRFLFESAALLHDCGHSPLSHSLEFLYNVGHSPASHSTIDRSIKRCDEILCEMFEGSPNFQDNLYRTKEMAKGDKPERILKNACGAPHERMSAYMIVSQNGYRAVMEELIRDQMLHFDSVHPELEGAAPEYGESELFSDLEFIVRAIIGCPYDENSRFWGEEENHRDIVYQLRNCIINLLHGIIDVDNIDYSIRDASSSGYKSAQVDYERLLKAETISLSYDHKEEGVTLSEEAFDHSLLLSSFVSSKIEKKELELVISGSVTVMVEWEETDKDSPEGFSVTGTLIEDDVHSGGKDKQRVLHLKPESSAHLVLTSGILKIFPRDVDKKDGTQVYIRSKCLSGTIHGVIFAGNHSSRMSAGGADLNNRIRQGKLRISPAFHKSALSVIQGALDATNFESRWIYSHHVTTYNNNFLSVFLLEMCANYYFEKEYDNLLKRLNHMLELYPRTLGKSTVSSVDDRTIEYQLKEAKKELQKVCEKLHDQIDNYPELKELSLPEEPPHFYATSNLEFYSLLLDALCKLCRAMPLIESEFHKQMKNRPCITLVGIVKALRTLPTDYCQGKELQPWEQASFDEDWHWVAIFSGYTMGMETMQALLGMPDSKTVNGQSFFRTSDSHLRSMYHNLVQNMTPEEKETHQDLMEAIQQSESRQYLKPMWKSHAEFHFYIHGWKQDWLKRPKKELSLVQRLFYTPDAPHDPKNEDVLYVYFSDASVKNYSSKLNQLWTEIKNRFLLDILVYVPQNIRHKELRIDQTYVVWKNRIVTLADIGIPASHVPGSQYFYLYYRLTEEGERKGELDVCAFMDFLRKQLIKLEENKLSSDTYGETGAAATKDEQSTTASASSLGMERENVELEVH